MPAIDFSEKEKTIRTKLPKIKALLEDNLVADPFYKDFKYRFCWSSNAIEGNTLSLEETISLIEYDEVRSGHSFTEYREAKNLYNAIEKYFSYSPQEITLDWIKDIAYEVTGIERGFRDTNVYIGTSLEAVYYPPDHTKLNELMLEYARKQNLATMQKTIDEKVSFAAGAHILFERIHPFLDGNGRTGRIILNQNLVNSGLLPVVIESKSKYRDAFKRYDRTRDTSFMKNLIYKEEVRSIEKIEYIAKKRDEIDKSSENKNDHSDKP